MSFRSTYAAPARADVGGGTGAARVGHWLGVAAEDREGELAEAQVEHRDERHHEDDEHHDHQEVGDQLLLGRVDHLAQLGDDLPVERGDARALLGPALSRTADGLAVRHASSPLLVRRPGRRRPAVQAVAAVHLCCCPAMLILQGTRDLNPQPSVLETDALPVELVPSDGRPAFRAGRSMWETTKRGVYGQDRGRVQTGPAGARRIRVAETRPAPARPRLYDGAMTATSPAQPGPAARGAPATAASRSGSARSPSPRRSRWTPRPRRSRPRAARSSGSAPASPTSRPRRTSSRPPSRRAATRGTTATPPPAACRS